MGKKKGQALLELAIFGAFLLLLLGVLVNYGMTYYFQMKVKAEAFRNTMAASSWYNVNNTSSSVTTVYLKDKYIPDPSSPSGIGYTTPISASASAVNRNPDLRVGPENDAELPTIQLFLDNEPPMKFTSGKFVTAYLVTKKQLKKYSEIYGDALGCSKWNNATGTCNTTAWKMVYNNEGEISSSLLRCCGTNCSTGAMDDPVNGTCSNSTIRAIKYPNYVEGQFMNYGSAVRQCRQLVNSGVCTGECLKGRGGMSSGNATKCDDICNQTINIPWYCGNATLIDPLLGTYNFTNLNSIFEGIVRKTGGTLGVQPSYDKTSHWASFVELNADSAYLQAQDVLCFSDKIRRWVVYRPVNATGNQTNVKMVETNVSSAITVHEKTKW